jgi:soluble methane monooxygenase-binding protein MmoD
MNLHDMFADNPAPEAGGPHCEAAVLQRHEIEGQGRYSATLEDLGFMWRWRIFRDAEHCQEGCSLTEGASREAVAHVLAFYNVRDGSEGAASVSGD